MEPGLITDEQRQELTHANSPYSAEDRVAVAIAYLMTGENSHQAAALCPFDIEPGTIRQWKKRGGWWLLAMDLARKFLNEELEAKYTVMMHKTVDSLMDRLEHGDEVITKDGIQRVEVKAADLLKIHDKLSERRALLRGDGTAKSAVKKDDPISLAVKLAKLLHQKGAEQGITIEQEVIEHAEK